MAAMHRQRLLRKGVKSLPTNCAWFVGLAILWHVSHFQCLSRTASMGRVRWRKLVLLSLLMGLSKQLTSSNSFITWASLCEMVYSLRIRLCGVSYPPNLSPRRLFAYFPLQGCTDPPTPPHPTPGCSASVLPLQMHWVMSFSVCQTSSLRTCRFLRSLSWPLKKEKKENLRCQPRQAECLRMGTEA